MRIFGFELKKLLFHQWGTAIILFYLLAQLGLLLGQEPTNQDALLYREEYYHYLDYVSGSYTQEKAEFLETEATRITEAKANLRTLYQQYYIGSVTEDELQSEAQRYQDVLRYENGFDVIYDQYLYICEGKENRCFLDTNGWDGLLSEQILDLPLVLAVLLLSTPVFCREYACGMDQLALATRNGRKNYVWHKVLMTLAVISVLCLAGAILRYCFCAVRYGLPHGNYMLQSIGTFGNSKKMLSLLQAFFFFDRLPSWRGALSFLDCAGNCNIMSAICPDSLASMCDSPFALAWFAREITIFCSISTPIFTWSRAFAGR